jgi:hypothetical protein
MTDERKEKIDSARADFLQQLRACFDSPAGKPTLAWLHATAGTKSPAYSPGGSANDAIWRDGRKSIILEIEANLEQARADYGKSNPTHKPPTTGGRATRRKSG